MDNPDLGPDRSIHSLVRGVIGRASFHCHRLGFSIHILGSGFGSLAVPWPMSLCAARHPHASLKIKIDMGQRVFGFLFIRNQLPIFLK
jgi:hypothetical protein